MQLGRPVFASFFTALVIAIGLFGGNKAVEAGVGDSCADDWTGCGVGFQCNTSTELCEVDDNASPVEGIEPSSPDGFSPPAPAPAPAPAPVPSATEGSAAVPDASYNQIIAGPGLIFAGICADEGPDVEGQSTYCACRAAGQCSLDNMMQIFVNITELILGIIGSLILLMFIYGGFLWITSRGDAERVKKGKDTVTNAVIGLAIILLSYSMINFVIAALAGLETPGANLEDTLDQANPDNIEN